MTPDLSRRAWRKSSHSGGENGECVEVCLDGRHAALRDSKNPAGAVLTFDAAAFGRFLAAVKRREFKS